MTAADFPRPPGSFTEALSQSGPPIAESSPLEGDDSATVTQPPFTGFVLKLGDQEWAHPRTLDNQPDGCFRATKTLPRWALLKVAVAEKRKDEEAQGVAVFELAMASIVKDDRDKLDQYLLNNDDAFDRLQDGLGDLVKAWTGRPSEPSPASSQSSVTEAMPPLLRRVSLSEGTLSVQPAPSTEETWPPAPTQQTWPTGPPSSAE